jgi:signal transduction histidine kinase
VVPYELPFVLAVPLVPAAAAAAVLRYHLYDIDRLVTRGGAYAILATFTTLLYLALLIGVGSFAGARRSDLALAVVATATAAVLFQPARGRIEALIRRVVLGPRATPYATLAAFSRDVAGAASTDDLPRRMAAAVAAGIGAVHVVVTVPLPDGAEQTSTWPPDLPARGTTTAAAGGVPYTATVHHERRVVGHIAVVMPDGRAVTATERRLLDDLAAQCGPALRTVALTEELRRTLEEVQASRLRIVAAQDQERQRIERDLHDGVQQHLHALSANLGVVAQHARDDRVLSEGIERAAEQADRAQATLRALVRGICPPILHDRGLAAAVRAAGDAAEVPFTLDVTGGTQRWPRAVETAAYFCCREALQNAAKHACAQHVTVRFDGTADLLTFTVSDDGRGFDPSTHRNGTGLHNLTDRLAAVGGRLEITSTPNAGTTVAGRIPTTST